MYRGCNPICGCEISIFMMRYIFVVLKCFVLCSVLVIIVKKNYNNDTYFIEKGDGNFPTYKDYSLSIEL